MTLAPFFIMIIVLVLLLIIFLVYFNIYKRRINKNLEKGESTAHISMVSTETIGRILMIIGIVLFAISTIIQLAGITSDIEETKYELKSEINNLNWEISELQMELEKQNAILNSFGYSFGEVNTENNTVEVMFECVPKSFSEDTTITLVWGNQTVVFETGERGKFTATKNLPLFTPLGYEIIVSVTTGEVTNTQIISDIEESMLCFECLPHFESYTEELTCEFTDKKLSISGKYFGMENSGEIKDIQLLFIVDNNIVKKLDGTQEEISIKEVFKLDKNSKIELVEQGVDKYGYTHRTVIFTTSEEYSYCNSIISKEGHILAEVYY